MRKVTLITTLTILGILALSFLAEAGVVWLACWCLKAIGISTIAGWTVGFSWPLVLLCWIISWLARGLFKAAAND